jgi:hypothetical protein
MSARPFFYSNNEVLSRRYFLLPNKHTNLLKISHGVQMIPCMHSRGSHLFYFKTIVSKTKNNINLVQK